MFMPCPSGCPTDDNQHRAHCNGPVRPRAGHVIVSIIRRGAAVAVLAGTIDVSAGCVAVNTPPVGRKTDKQPIVFVHGYTAQNLATWALVKPALTAAGYGGGDMVEFNYNSTVVPAITAANSLATVVQR